MSRYSSFARFLFVPVLFFLSLTALAVTPCGTVSQTLKSISVTPATITVSVGLTQRFAAVGTYACSNGRRASADISQKVKWSSSSPAAATISISGSTIGLAAVPPTAVVGVQTRIRAVLSGVSGSAVLTVGPASVQSISVTAPPLSPVPPLAITPTTTLTSETSNNTSASPDLKITSNGNAVPGHVSDISIKTLAYPTFTGKIIASTMGWWGQAGHHLLGPDGTNDAGYNSQAQTQILAQKADMQRRGIDGISLAWYGQGAYSDGTLDAWLTTMGSDAGFTVAGRVEDAIIINKLCPADYTCANNQDILTNQLKYFAKYFSSSAYMKIDGRPVVFFFMSAITCPVTDPCDFTAAKLAVNGLGLGNPIFIFKDKRFDTKIPGSDGGMSWGVSHALPANSSDGYFKDFYATAQSQAWPGKYIVGEISKGMDNSAATWQATQGVRFQDQRCGQRWLDGWAEMTKYGVTAHNYDYVHIPTWNDYEEGTEIESGIDNCFTITASIGAPTLSFAPTSTNASANERTIDHYVIWISTDGQNLMQVGGNKPAGTRTLDLAPINLAPGNYTFYVEAVGKPSILNQMSQPVTYAVAAGSSPYSGTSSSATITAGIAVQFTATASYSDGTKAVISNTAAWSSSDNNIASVNTAGLATGISAGKATITAAKNGVKGTATLTVQ